jgi:hypothetical protein
VDQLKRDGSRALARLKRDVARDRLVFGQHRQDDLLTYLGDIPPDKLAELRIDLSPRRLTSEAHPARSDALTGG